MVDDRVTHRSRGRFRSQQGQKADAVFPGILRERGPDELRAGGEEISLGDEGAGAAARGHVAGPPDDEWHAMPALVEVRLVAPPPATRIVVKRLELRQARRRCEPVVGGDDHERVIGKPGAVEGVEEPADVGIDLGHEVAVERRAGAALECGGW